MLQLTGARLNYCIENVTQECVNEFDEEMEYRASEFNE